MNLNKIIQKKKPKGEKIGGIFYNSSNHVSRQVGFHKYSKLLHFLWLLLDSPFPLIHRLFLFLLSYHEEKNPLLLQYSFLLLISFSFISKVSIFIWMKKTSPCAYYCFWYSVVISTSLGRAHMIWFEISIKIKFKTKPI